MNNLTCKLNLPLGPSIRDPSLEADLQARIEDGHRVFAVGDVHGHLATFRALLHRLRLKPDDRVICLGDMIDRGPDSAGMVALLRTHPQLIAIKGNHEHMAVQSVQADGSFEAWAPWMKRGGKSTYASYIVQAEGDLWQAKRTMLDDFIWLDALPTQIVLDRIRLVHAGYDPRMPLDMQGEKELLYIRKTWFTHEGSVDPARTVFFGHTTTTKLGEAGEVAYAPTTLPDGRPAWVGLDVGAYNHVAPGITAVNIHTLREIKQPTLRCDRWFERIDRRSRTAKNQGRVWKGESNMKEADVAISFGLTVLNQQRQHGRGRARKAKRDLEQVGVVFPPSLDSPVHHGRTAKGHRIVHRSRPHQWSMHARGPTAFRVYHRTGELEPISLHRQWRAKRSPSRA